MKIGSLFHRDINRKLNGVVKADQLDEQSVWQELDEFVVTQELDRHVRKFFSQYCEGISSPGSTDLSGKIGIWVSGFFGSGKSHFIKVLSHLLANKEHSYEGSSKRAIEFFEDKIQDAMVLGEMKQAVSSETDVILFNIDSKASSSSGRDAILDVFLRVFNEHLGFCKEHKHIAHMERYLDEKGKYQDFKDAFERHTGTAWVDERDAYEFNRDEVVQSLSEVLGQSEESCAKWVDSAESTFQLTVEIFADCVKEYLDSQETGHRIVFLVDEVGQFIGGDTHLMLNLQTITEKLGTVCKGRAWVVVTSQEDMEAIIGDLGRGIDFSKIQGRFKTRLSLSSANVDEVIRKRLLHKKDEVCGELTDVFNEKKDVLNNQLSFRDVGTTYKEFQDADDFVHTYPFAPYQFKLLQRVFESIRKAGATGLHLSEGERSLLDAFQVAAESVLEEDVGVLIPLYAFYPSIEEFMDTAVKRTVEQAGENSSLKPFDIKVLQVLFLIRYVEEMKGNVENLATLCLDKIDCDRLALKRQIEESLLRLEKESLISRSGDVYCFLTNEERDINREIKKLATSSAEEAKVLGSIIFEDALKDQKKHRFSRTNQDMPFNRLCDQHPFGRLDDDNPQFSVVTPLSDDYGDYNDQSCTLKSAGDNGKVLLVLKDNEALGRELKMYLRTDKYLKANDDTTAEQATRRIHRDLAGENQQRRTRLGSLVEEMLGDASCYIAGTKYELRSNDPSGLLKESLDYLIENTFSKLGYLKKLTENPVREMQAILRNDDAGQHALNLTLPDSNPEALEEVRKYIDLMTSRNSEIVMYDMCSDRFAKRPYGWPENETALLLVRLFAAGEILFVQAGQPIGKDSLPSTVPEQRNWRRIKIIQKVAAKAEDVKKAREVGRDVFSEMGPEDPDSLSEFLRTKLRAWKDTLARYQEHAEGDAYPGGETIAGALVTIESCLSVNDNKKFLERFNDNKEALLDLSEDFHALDGFYTNQKPTWDKMLRSSQLFDLNRQQLEQDSDAKAALERLKTIREAPSPYGMVREIEPLLGKIAGVNTKLLESQREASLKQIAAQHKSVEEELKRVSADENLTKECLQGFERLQSQVRGQDSLAHINQAEADAIGQKDIALEKISQFVSKPKDEGGKKSGDSSGGTKPKTAFKKVHVVEPKSMASQYLETQADVDAFIAELKDKLDGIIKEQERIEIR